MTIMIAYDGSDDARAAVEFAARHLRPEPVTVLTVWEPMLSQLAWAPLAAGGPIPAADPAAEEWTEQEHAAKVADDGAARARAAGFTDVTARAERCDGPAWSAIVDVADELDATLIVTGSRGLSGARSVLLGSVSTRVLHHTRRPVLIVPPAS
ncbi:universal stress protein [Actinomadura kijaniata]|uniref:universal stress protein n=1 Tax=Actinomadura kijaniata TaxID=46161 RepID=UPI003F1C7E81